MGVVLVLFLRDCWFGGMIGRIRLVGGRVMREGERLRCGSRLVRAKDTRGTRVCGGGGWMVDLKR